MELLDLTRVNSEVILARALSEREGINDASATPEFLRESFAYTDTLGPASVRENFARVYGADWGVAMNPGRLIPTVGATGGINLLCSLFERAGQPVAYIADAPTYAGFLARASLGQVAEIFSVEMDDEGPIPELFSEQIQAARASGRFVPFYYTVPDGHNPAGISFSQARREAILAIAAEEGVLVIEDAPYLYISYQEEGARPQPFVAMDARRSVHLFTGSKIGFPGPRVGFVYTEAELAISGGEAVPLTDLLLTESSADILFHNPEALRGFESILHDEQMNLRPSLWSVAKEKLAVYAENRAIVLGTLESRLGDHKDLFHWTIPEAGFFTVFSFLDGSVSTDDDFVAGLVADHGVVVIPMYDFYPPDAKTRDPKAGLNQLRLSFCFTESEAGQRAADLQAAIDAFCVAVKAVYKLA